jgi:hypothetical protein
MRNYLVALLMLAFVGCTPSYATNGALTPEGCTAVQSAAKDILGQYRGGTDQFKIFQRINQEPRSYWNNDEVAKVYTQTIIIDLKINVTKGYNDTEILKKVKTSCEEKLGMTI